MTDYKTINDIDKDESFILVTNTQDIKATILNIGLSEELLPGCLFVKFDESEADYSEIYACENTVPYLNYPITKIFERTV